MEMKKTETNEKDSMENIEIAENTEGIGNNEHTENLEDSESAQSPDEPAGEVITEASSAPDNTNIPDQSDSSESTDNSDDSDSSPKQDFSKKSAEGFRNFKAIAEAFARGRGIKEEEYSKVIDTISSIRSGFENGEITLDCFELIHKGINYDKDVASAATEGELKGRNDVISEKIFPERQDDGLPHFNSGHTSLRKSRSNSIFDLARNAQ